MVLSAAAHSDMVIQQAELEASAGIITSLEADMPRVFDLIGMQGQAKHATEVLSFIRSYGEITQTALYRLCFKSMGWKDFQDALVSCQNSKQIEMQQDGGNLRIKFIKTP